MNFEVGLEADFYGVDCNCFKLNNCVFEAVEDESDGYRSMMSDVQMKDNTDGLIFFQTPVARVRVVDWYQHYGKDFEGYALIDVKDEFPWLVLGTDNSYDYYPSFYFYYQHKHEFVLKKFEE